MSNWENNAFPNKVVKDGALLTQVKGSDIAQPMEIQFRRSQTIRTHDNVSVGASGNSSSGWFDCSGFDEIGITFQNSASANSRVTIQWSHDGVNLQGQHNNIIPVSTLTNNSAEIKVRARYARIVLMNDDTTARTMSAWAYLKV